MGKGINLIMPMGGNGSRFSERGYQLPKPLLTIQGKPFFYWSTQSIRKYVHLESLIFVVLREHIDKFQIDEEIRRYFPEAEIVLLEHVLNGAVLTCARGIQSLTNHLPVLFNDCDHIFTCDSFYRYCNTGSYSELDGALLTFPSRDPKFSYVEMDAQGRIKHTVEKKVVSDQAICGAYYFRNRKLFEDAAKIYLDNCTYKEYFVSGVYNVMSENNAIIRNFTVDMHLPFGTPQEYEEAVYSSYFSKLL